jgi:integrase/recombinase XerD
VITLKNKGKRHDIRFLYKKRNSKPRTAHAVRALPRALKSNEVEYILRAAKSERDRLIFQVALYMGLRVSEIQRLRIEHFDFNNGAAFIVKSKYGRERHVPVHEKLTRELRHWIGQRHAGPVFLSRQNNPIHPRTIQKMLQCVRNGFGVTPHTFRHTAATRLLQSGASIRVVQDFLGHSSPSTTAIYTHVSINDIIRASNNVPWIDVLPENQMKLI